MSIQTDLDNNGFVFIPLGETVLEEPLVVSNDSIITGSGLGSVLSFPSVIDGPCIVNRDTADSLPGNNNIILQNFSIKGADSGLPTGPITQFSQGIRLQKVSNFSIFNVGISHTGFGMFLVGVKNGTVNSCNVNNTGRDGIHLVGYMLEDVEVPYRMSVENVLISNNIVQDTGDDCIAIHCGAESGRNKNITNPPSNIIVSNNIVGNHPEHIDAQGRGVIFTGIHNSQILNNLISNTVSCGVWLQEDHHSNVVNKQQTKNVVCKDNMMTNVGQINLQSSKPRHAIRLNGVDGCKINNNFSKNHKDRFIRGDKVVNTDYSGNNTDVQINRIEVLCDNIA